MQRALVLFAKAPAVGQTKTRLASTLGASGAVELYRHLLLDTVAMVRHMNGVQLAVAYAPDNAAPFFRALLPQAHLFPQRGDDLGARMNDALCQMFHQGCGQVALVGADIPLLEASTIAAAFDYLDTGADAVFGPADDGGYFLVGLTRPQPALFREMTYSVANVLSETLLRATVLGLDCALLPFHYDIDTADDLTRLGHDLAGAPAGVALHTRAFLADTVHERRF